MTVLLFPALQIFLLGCICGALTVSIVLTIVER